MPDIHILVRTVKNKFQKSCRVFTLGPKFLLPSNLGFCPTETYKYSFWRQFGPLLTCTLPVLWAAARINAPFFKLFQEYRQR
jgi:hypothetical protein